MARRCSQSSVSYRALDEPTVEALLGKLRSRDSFSADDCDALLGVVQTWAHLTEVAAGKSATINQVREVLGISPPRKGNPKPDEANGREACDDSSANSESDALPQDEVLAEHESKPQQKNRSRHGRRGSKDFENLVRAHHQHTLLTVRGRAM